MKKYLPQSAVTLVKGLASSIIIYFNLTLSVSAQCTVVGSGNVTGNVNYGSSNNWANPNRCTLSDDLHSRVKLDAGETSKYLLVSDFGYVIPPGATIDGIEVRIEGHQEDFTAVFADASIMLLKGGAPVGVDHGGTGYYDDKDYVNVYGTSADLWGFPWTPADIMDPGFGVVYSVTRLGGPGTYYMFVDYVEVTVYFSGDGCILPVTLKNMNASVHPNQMVQVDWTTASEANTAFFEVERSLNGADFTGIGTVDAQGSSIMETAYTFMDVNPLMGSIFYRLRMVDVNGQSQYSEVRTVKTSPNAHAVTAYPNPAHGQLHFKGDIDGGTAELLDLSGKMVLQQNLEAGCTLDIKDFAPGMYVLRVRNFGLLSSQRVFIQ
jgi:hypothetical protein